MNVGTLPNGMASLTEFMKARLCGADVENALQAAGAEPLAETPIPADDVPLTAPTNVFPASASLTELSDRLIEALAEAVKLAEQAYARGYEIGYANARIDVGVDAEVSLSEGVYG